MTHKRVSKFLPYTTDEMFNLVADIERYPEFVPYCHQLKILAKKTYEQSEILTAKMAIKFHMLQESFTSEVQLQKNDYKIDVHLISGPFRNLTNQWQFVRTDNGCQVNFMIDYQFNSRTLEFLMGKMFATFFDGFVSSFEQRARKLYGGTNDKKII